MRGRKLSESGVREWDESGLRRGESQERVGNVNKESGVREGDIRFERESWGKRER